MVVGIKKSSIDEVFSRCVGLLNNDMKTIGDRTGWHHFIGGNKVGDLATAQGILIYNYVGYKSDKLHSLVQTLLDAQFRNPLSKDDGAWSYLSSRATPTIEPSSWSALGIKLGASESQTDVLRLASDWIKRNQNSDGGWGPRKGFESRVYSTFLALRCLERIDIGFLEQATQTLDWLTDIQNDDGGWGILEDEESTPAHTAFALISLAKLGVKHSSPVIQKGLLYLYSTWDPANMWEETLRYEEYELPEDEVRWTTISIYFFTSAWIITALLFSREKLEREELQKCILWLIDNQSDDGSWDLRGVPRTRLWAVHDAVYALKTLIDSEQIEEKSDTLGPKKNA